MIDSVTFLHASDLHLGAAFRGLRSISTTWADRLVAAIPEAFQEMIRIAIEEKVDFVILAGDIFDSSHPSYADYCLFRNGMNQLADKGIPVYFCMGNHDPYTVWVHDYGALPENVYAFDPQKPSFFVFEKEGQPAVVLGGRSYLNQSWPTGSNIAEGITRQSCLEFFRAHKKASAQDVSADAPSADYDQIVFDADPFCVGVIHTGLDIDPTRSPTDPKDLLRRSLDYWACGHIHKMHCYPEDAPEIAFSGCIQGRDIHETGSHGVLKVTLSKRAHNSAEFFPTSRVDWERIRVDVSDCNTISDIQEQITNEQFIQNSSSHCQSMMCRIILTGRTSLSSELTPSVLSDMRTVVNDRYPFFFIDDIVNETMGTIDHERLKAEGLFPATFLQTMEIQTESQLEAINYLEKQFLEYDLPVMRIRNKDYPLLCEKAEALVLDLLNRDDVS